MRIDLRVSRSTLVRNTFWMLGGNGLRLVIQAAYFIIIARSLEPKQYGAFVAAVALTAILSPFVGLGTSNLITRNVARDRGLFSSSWGNGLLVTIVTGAVALALVLGCRSLLPPDIHWTVLLLVATADLLFARLIDFCGCAFGALERFGATAQLNVSFSLTRLIGLAVLATLIHHPRVEQWAAVYLAATAATAVGAVMSGLRAFGRPTTDTCRIWNELGEGFYFSVGQSAQNIYNDIDKTMLAKLGDLSATGIYGAAYRIVEVSMVPVRSVISAAYPGVFRAGQGGLLGSLRYIRELLPRAIIYCGATLLGTLLFAPVTEHILGHEYAQSVEALRWLAVLPLLKTIHSFLADALTGAGHQRVRTVMQVLVAGVNVLVNLWIIPAYSWRGAAWSSIASDAMLVGLLAIAAQSIARKELRDTSSRDTDAPPSTRNLWRPGKASLLQKESEAAEGQTAR